MTSATIPGPSDSEQASRWECRRRRRYVSKRTGLPGAGRCWNRRCEGCGLVMSISDRELIGGGLLHQLENGRPVIMLTVTEGAEPRGWVESADGMRLLMQTLRRNHGGGFPSLWVA